MSKKTTTPETPVEEIVEGEVIEETEGATATDPTPTKKQKFFAAMKGAAVVGVGAGIALAFNSVAALAAERALFGPRVRDEELDSSDDLDALTDGSDDSDVDEDTTPEEA